MTSEYRPKLWEAAVLAILLVVLVDQLVLPPVVGMADNGDFARVAGYFSIGYQPGQPHPHYFKYSTVTFVVDPANHWRSGFVSSEIPIAFVAILASRLAGFGPTFDIRFLGMAHVLLLVLAVWLTLVYARRFPLAARIALAGMFLLVFTDVAYVAYFNSFYSEPAVLLFFLFVPPTAGALLASRGRVQAGLLGAFLTASLLFTAAKPQNALAGVLLAAYTLLLLGLRADLTWRALTVGGVTTLLLCSVATYAMTPVGIRRMTMHLTVFSELLAHSPTPDKDLEELGLPQTLLKYRGTTPWQWTPATTDDPEFARTFADRMGMTQIALFYLGHPARLVNLLDRSASLALVRRSTLGNFEASTGVPPRTLSQRYAWWTQIKDAVAPTTVAGISMLLALFTLPALAVRSRLETPDRRLVDLLVVVVAIAVLQYVTVSVTTGTHDTTKYMLAFRVIVDLLAIVYVAALTGLLSVAIRRHRSAVRRAPGRAIDEVRARQQSQDREGPGGADPAVAALQARRGSPVSS